MTAKKTVLYILSLSHSGSTLLDLLLSHHNDVIGLGEAFFVLKKKAKTIEQTENICSCGKKPSDCTFWGNYKPEGTDYEKNYEKLLTLTSKKTIVDSSKKTQALDYLKKLQDSGKINLKVVFLLKDVRGWTVSISNAMKRGKGLPRPSLYYCFLWYMRNKRLKKYLESHSLDYVQIGYEDLCFNTDKTMIRIFEHAQLPKKHYSLENLPTTHIAYGNRMKTKQEKITIKYDNRWCKRYWLNLLLLLFLPFVFLWNKKNTYSHER